MPKIDYGKAKEVTDKASMKEQEKPKLKNSTSKKLGRPKKTGESATEKIMINVTPTQKEKIVEFANNQNSTISGVIKNLLTEKGII